MSVRVRAAGIDHAAGFRAALEMAGSDLSYDEKAERARQGYAGLGKNLLSVDPASLDDKALSLRFSGLYVFWYFLKEPGIPGVMEPVFRELAARDAATPRQYVSMQDVFLESHQFQKAAELAEEYPAVRLVSVPGKIDAEDADGKALKYYEVLAGAKTAKLRSLDLPAGPSLVIYGDPTCGFTREAVEALASDERTAALFPASAILVTPGYNFDAVSDWNKDHALKFKVMFAKKDWGFLKTVYKPGFNFFNNGHPVCYAHGWDGDSTVGEILKCAEEAGFNTTEGGIKSALRAVSADFSEVREYESNVRAMRLTFQRLRAAGAFSAAKLAGYQAENLSEAFLLCDRYFFNSPAHDGLTELVAAFSELEKRGMVDAERAGLQHNAYLTARDFVRAGALAQKYPGLPLLDFHVGARIDHGPDEAVLYRFMGPGAGLRAEKFNKSGKHVFLAAAPNCSGSKNALLQIAKDPRLSGIFKKRGLVLFDGSDIGSAEKWNASHELKYLLADSADWPELDFSQVPAFYFVDEGKVVHSFTGWPKEGKLDEFFIGLGRLGIINR